MKLKLIFNKKNIFILISILSIIGYSFVVFAAAPSGGYTPGSTLDPDCAPGDVDCVVKLQISGGGSPAGSDNQIQINRSGSFFADSAFQKSDTGFNVGFPGGIVGGDIVFTGSGLDDFIKMGAFTGSAPITYTATVDGLNQAFLQVPTYSITGGSFSVGDTITNGTGGSSTVLFISTADFFGNEMTLLRVTLNSGSFSHNDPIDNGSGVTAYIEEYVTSDTITWTDGVTTVTNVPLASSNGILFGIPFTTGHTVGDSWTWTYSLGVQNVLDFSSNYYKVQSIIDADTFGYQISDNLLGVGAIGSLNTWTSGNGDIGYSGFVDLGDGDGFKSNTHIDWGGGASSDFTLDNGYVKLGFEDSTSGFDITGGLNIFNIASIQGGISYGLAQSNNSTILGNLAGGNGTKITIDDIAQTINFNNNYSFPFADGAAGQVLGTDGSGQLGWVTVSGGSVSPISIGTSGNTLYSSGLSGTGQGDTSTGNNIFLGINAGNGATDAKNSNFFGASAGNGATDAKNSNFFGASAGFGATNSDSSNFFGSAAGYYATNASDSNFLGSNAGNGATSASYSNFLGYYTGTNANNASNSIFIGTSAGNNDLVNNTGSPDDFSILIGPNTSTGDNGSGVGYSNSIALGGYATNTASNQFMIGSTTRPINSVFIGGNQGTASAVSTFFFGNGAGSNAANASNSNFLGYSAGYNATDASGSNFFGPSAGQNATYANHSNFFGVDAGNGATNAYYSNFFGVDAGNGALNANASNFFGKVAGYGATGASNSNFFGVGSGYGATGASNSNFLGESAGSGSANAYNSNFFGQNAGRQSTNASNSTFIGKNAGYNDLVNNTLDTDDFSILIGNNTSTGGFSNSIALGGYATNTASNQFMIGSVTRPITSMVLTGDYSGGSCTFAVGGMSCSSDERLKTNIEDLQGSTLDTILNIRTVNYNWNSSSDSPKQVGFIAQDLQQYFPELVSVGQGGYLQVNYAQMTPILVEAIREMNLKITAINDSEIENSWRDSLIAWFGNVGNGITELFVGRVRTHELCLDDVCVTKDQLQQLLQNSQQTIVPSSSGNPPTDPDPEITPDDAVPSDSDPIENPDDSGDSNSDTPTDDIPTE